MTNEFNPFAAQQEISSPPPQPKVQQTQQPKTPTSPLVCHILVEL